MKAWILTFVGSLSLFAADDGRIALALKAQTEFDRVELAGIPQLRDTTACIQSQASVLPVTARETLSLIHYRKGYCTLAGATITGDAAEFLAAVTEFEQAIEAWPGAFTAGKDKTPPPVPSGLRVLASIARLRAIPDAAAMERAQKDISGAVESPACASTIMPPAYCWSILHTGSEWLGWMAFRRDDMEAAARYLVDSADSGWSSWAAGRRAFRRGDYMRAEAEYRRAADVFQRALRDPAPSMNERLRPKPSLGLALQDWGSAQLLTNNANGAVVTLDAAVKADPSDARAIYFRARAKELAGQGEAAKLDYSLASRTAFANAKDLASGEAHLYRGILLYRDKDLTRAENEFSSALNFDVPAGLRADAVAWRHLAAVAGGSCGGSRESLERSLPEVSPYFPKSEAKNAMASCGSAGAGQRDLNAER